MTYLRCTDCGVIFAQNDTRADYEDTPLGYLYADGAEWDC